MKRSSQPIVASRVFGIEDGDDNWRLTSTASRHCYDGPVYTNPVPPYTADEWDALADLVVLRMNPFFSIYAGGAQLTYATARIEDAEAALRLLRVLGGDPRRAARFMAFPSIHEGIHGFRLGAIPEGYRSADVHAEVELFGRVVEYEHGYRAEKMRIRKLWLSRDYEDEGIEALSRIYDCEVSWLTLGGKSKSTKSSWTTRMRRAGSNVICGLADMLDSLDRLIDPDESE